MTSPLSHVTWDTQNNGLSPCKRMTDIYLKLQEKMTGLYIKYLWCKGTRVGCRHKGLTTPSHELALCMCR